MKKMIANSEKAYQDHIAKETSSTSIFAPPKALVDQRRLPSIEIKHFSSERQGIRKTMEDSSFFEKIEGGYVAGVFDGHGGPGVAKIASETFPESFSAALKSNKGDAYKAMRSTIETIHQRAVSEKSLKFVGSTAVTSFISDSGTIFTATVGDSAAFHYNGDTKGEIKSTPLSVVRDWSSLEEARRAARLANTEKEKVKRESWVGSSEPKLLRVKNPSGLALNLSSALGDSTYKEVSQKPVITVDQIGEKATLGYFCDGITDFVSQQEIVGLIKRRKSGNIAEKITDYAIKAKASTDNATALVLVINRKDND